MTPPILVRTPPRTWDSPGDAAVIFATAAGTPPRRFDSPDDAVLFWATRLVDAHRIRAFYSWWQRLLGYGKPLEAGYLEELAVAVASRNEIRTEELP